MKKVAEKPSPVMGAVPTRNRRSGRHNHLGAYHVLPTRNSCRSGLELSLECDARSMQARGFVGASGDSPQPASMNCFPVECGKVATVSARVCCQKLPEGF